jgi:hypothetical protein
MSWTGLVNAAVMGSGRQGRSGGTPETADVTLATIGLDPGDQQTRLLHGAAAMSRARRAGYRPPEAGQLDAPVPAEADHRPEVCLAAGRRLAEFLDTGHYDLIDEWLRCVAALGRAQRPPDMLVPALLTAAAGRPALHASLLPVLGPLAPWLAGFNTEWAWARGTGAARAEASASEVWETAGIDDRRALLTRLRRSDPAAGRELVASTWDVDSSRDRAGFVAMLAVGLSQDDESLAERALGDRRAEVRRAGANLLARLPGSRYSRRAVSRAAAVVRIQRTPRRPRLVLTIPETVTQEMLADGVDGSPPPGAGAGAWLVRQLVAAAPAALWGWHTGLEPAELLAVADHSDWSATLREGWAAAAIRDADQAWLLALLARPAPDRPGTDRHVMADLRFLTALDAGARDAWLLANPDSPLVGAALEALPAPWSVPLSDLVRDKLRTVARADPGYSPAPRALFRLAALRLQPPRPPDVDPAAVHDRLIASWNAMLSTLSVRAAMRRELSEEPKPWVPSS